MADMSHFVDNNRFEVTMNNKKSTNVVFILTDDQGAWAMGSAGNADIHTPNLDKLAKQGMRFDNFFCASPVCSPARATLLTGNIPSKHGVIDWLKRKGRNDLEFLEGQRFYTDYLAENGYACSTSGKWHVGNAYKPHKSFETCLLFGSDYNYNDCTLVRDGVEVPTKGYVSDVITDDAIAFIEKKVAEERPFYAAVHYTAPHAPWIGCHPKEIEALYEGSDFPSCPDMAPHPRLVHWGGEKDSDSRIENIKGYYAAVTAMDRAVGRLLDRLNALGIRENTLVIFTSDNGFNCGHHGIWGKGNGTFPQNMYDTSVKVPAIFSQPGRIPQDTVCSELVSQYDIFPTLLDYLSIEEADGDQRPGRSFTPLLHGESAKDFERVVVYDEYGSVRMIRTKELKYVHCYPFGPHELYHMISDPDETKNLVEEESMQASLHKLRAEMEKWFLRYADPEKDARQYAVSGTGQQDFVGAASEGREPFFHKSTILGPTQDAAKGWSAEYLKELAARKALKESKK